MSKEITITAEPRATRGKNEARRLRARGLAPAIIYGAGKDAQAVSVSPREINKILHSARGHNTLFNVQSNSETSLVMIVDWLRHPLREDLLHVDLKRIDPSKKLHVKIPVNTTGEPRGVKEQGGLFEVVTREVEIECLPDEIPDQFTVDVRELMLHQNLRASEIPMAESIRLVTNPDAVIAHVVGLRTTVEETAAATAEGAATATAEPEVIKKGKKEEEGAAPEKPEKKK